MAKHKKKPEPKRDEFIESDKHVLDGVKLYPWTPDRVIAGQAMGMLYPRIGKDGAEQYKRTGTYPGALKDVIICLWLCTQTPEHVDEADIGPGDAYKVAKIWAAGLGIHKMADDKFGQAYDKFKEIILEVDQAYTTPTESAPGEEPDEGN